MAATRNEFNFICLPRSFYLPTADKVAGKLLGHSLIRRDQSGLSAGMIVETEAYLTGDAASHSFRGETKRNRAMWGAPGHAYVYFIYGNHWCVNAVCRPAGFGEAVLIRAIEPILGLEAMQARRAVKKPHDLSNGPGKLCAALAIDRQCDGIDLCEVESPLFIARNPTRTQTLKQFGPVGISSRVGISQATELQLRFYLLKNPYVSRHRAIAPV